MTVNMIVPPTFAAAKPEEIAAKTNGCGPANRRWLAELIPNNVLGADFEPACRIHDWMYGEGTSEDEKHFADRTFLFNLLATIDSLSCPEIEKHAQRHIAWNYYEAVRDFGDSAFWAGKVRT